jgi:hypothetical protein
MARCHAKSSIRCILAVPGRVFPLISDYGTHLQRSEGFQTTIDTAMDFLRAVSILILAARIAMGRRNVEDLL